MTNSNKSSSTSVKIWDVPIRVFHWLIVAAIAFLWWSGESGGNVMDWHLMIGVAVIALVLFRIIWESSVVIPPNLASF